MGVVFLARDTRLGRTLALKALPEDVAQDPDRMQRFEREARVLASLSHPNIAAIYGLEESEGRKYLALEHIEGETLADRIARGAIPLHETLDLAIQVASGMEAAHDAGVVHRDLKPANIMITSNDQVKILDFGLAKGRVATDESGLAKSPAMIDSPATLSSPTLAHSPTFMGTMPGLILGTAAYLSPEQARGKVVDRRTDIWSFGCVLYECLTGKLAFEGETVSDTIAKILERPMDWSSLPKATPPRLRELLERCLERDPKRRLRDIGDARLTLEEIKSGRGTEATAVPAPAGLRTVVIAAGALVLGAVLGLAAWSALHRSGSSEDRVAFYAVPLPRDTRFAGGFADDRTMALICAPVGSGANEANSARLYLRTFDQPEFQAVPGTEGVVRAILSPDGRTVEYWAPAAEGTSDLRRYRMPADRSAPPASVGDVGPTWDGDCVWLDSGDVIASLDDGSRYVRLSPNGNVGTPVAIKSPVPGGRFFIAGRELPGGHAVLMRGLWYEGSVYHQGVGVLDLGSGRVKMLLPDGSSPQYHDGMLYYSKLDAVYAVRFDPGALRVHGAPIAIMNGLRQDRTSLNANFGLSPAGTLYYASGGNVTRDRRLVVFDPQGNATEWSSERRPYEYGLRASPDGSRVMDQINNSKAITELWISKRGDPNARRVRSRPGSDVVAMAWSADGRWAAFAQNATDSTDGIYIVDMDGASEPRRIARKPAPTSYLLPSSWSPDGVMATTLVQNNLVSIWAMRVNPNQTELSSPHKILGGEFNVALPMFAPDGRTLAYQSNESGRPEIYVTAWSGEGPSGAPILVSRGGGEVPRWSRDGKRVYYYSQGRLMVVPIGPGLVASAPAVAWNLAALRVPPNGLGEGLYDLLPDGRLVAVQASENEGNVTEIRTALHFDKLVKQKMRAASK